MTEPPQELWIHPERKLKDQLRKGYSIMLKVRYWRPLAVTDPAVRHLVFYQLKSDVVSGRLYASEQVATRLAAYALQAQLGNHFPLKHRTGFLDDVGIQAYLPPSVTMLPVAIGANDDEEIDQRERRNRYWQRRLFKIHKELLGMSENIAEEFFVRLASVLPGYGIAPVPLRSVDGKEWYVGVSSQGLMYIPDCKREDGSKPWEIVPFADIAKWFFSHSGNALEVELESGKKFKFVGRPDRLEHVYNLLLDYRAIELGDQIRSYCTDLSDDEDDDLAALIHEDKASATSKAAVSEGIEGAVDGIASELLALEANLDMDDMSQWATAGAPEFDFDMSGLEGALEGLDNAFGDMEEGADTPGGRLRAQSIWDAEKQAKKEQDEKRKAHRQKISQGPGGVMMRLLQRQLDLLPPRSVFSDDNTAHTRFQPMLSAIGDFKRVFLAYCDAQDCDPPLALLDVLDKALDALDKEQQFVDTFDFRELEGSPRFRSALCFHIAAQALHKTFAPVNADPVTLIHRAQPNYNHNLAATHLKLNGLLGLLKRDPTGGSDPIEDMLIFLRFGKVQDLDLSGVGLGSAEVAYKGLAWAFREMTRGPISDKVFEDWSNTTLHESTPEHKQPPNPNPVAELDLSNNLFDDGIIDAVKFMCTRSDSRLMSLNIANNHIGSAGIDALAVAFKANMSPKIACLNVSGNPFPSDVAGELLEYVWDRTLTSELRINEVTLDHAFAQKLASLMLKGGATGMKILGLNKCSLGRKSTKLILGALSSNPPIEILNLAQNEIDGSAAEQFAKAMKTNTHLVSATFMRCKMDKKALKYIIEGVSRCRITTLDVSYNEAAGKDHIKRIIESCGSLEKLAMSGEKSIRDGISLLADHFRSGANKALTGLYLDFCGLGDKELIDLLDGVSYDTKLETLSLASNSCTGEGIEAALDKLAGGFRNKGYLRRLDLQANEYQKKQIVPLRSRALTTLHPQTACIIGLL